MYQLFGHRALENSAITIKTTFKSLQHKWNNYQSQHTPYNLSLCDMFRLSELILALIYHIWDTSIPWKYYVFQSSEL